ncbi:MAG TPA: hypothetical protein GX743_11150 [Actinomycetales bacterium]|nr:hypothetical protein [Actinomycetales bacterium]
MWVPAHLPPDELEILKVVVGQIEGAWISHNTAGAVRGLLLPVPETRLLHVSRPRGSRATQRAGVIAHQRAVNADELEVLGGVQVSRPERIWLEIGQIFDVENLVVLGDHLVRHPRPGLEARHEPYTSIHRLREVMDRYPNTRGARRLREALPLIRVGADSRPETLCRLALVRAGLPEPELQIPLHPDDPYSYSADLGYKHARLAIQYDGAHHFSEAGMQRLARRDAAFVSEGWTVFTATGADLHEGFATLVAQVRARLGGDPFRQ